MTRYRCSPCHLQHHPSKFLSRAHGWRSDSNLEFSHSWSPTWEFSGVTPSPPTLLPSSTRRTHRHRYMDARASRPNSIHTGSKSPQLDKWSYLGKDFQDPENLEYGRREGMGHGGHIFVVSRSVALWEECSLIHLDLLIKARGGG